MLRAIIRLDCFSGYTQVCKHWDNVGHFVPLALGIGNAVAQELTQGRLFHSTLVKWEV